LAGHRVWFNADQNFGTAFAEPFHEEAVVAADLEHGMRLRECPDRVELVGLMWLRLPAAEIVVELAIENIRVDRLHNLGQAAIGARHYFERKPLLRFIPAAQQAMGNRHLAEIDDGT